MAYTPTLPPARESKKPNGGSPMFEIPVPAVPVVPPKAAMTDTGQSNQPRLLRNRPYRRTERDWPVESLDAVRRFGQPHAKLFPFIGRKVRTPANRDRRPLPWCTADSGTCDQWRIRPFAPMGSGPL